MEGDERGDDDCGEKTNLCDRKPLRGAGEHAAKMRSGEPSSSEKGQCRSFREAGYSKPPYLQWREVGVAGT